MQPQYTSSPPSILLTASTTRSAAQNKILAVEKLHELIASSAESCIVTPTSAEQKEKVANLAQREDRRRKVDKIKRGGKKESRKKGNWD
jgi:peptidyl-tRNA hydrolase ICT1